MTDKMPPIPKDLQRSPSSPVPIKRRTVELPKSIDSDGVQVDLESLSLPALADYQTLWKQRLADVPRMELELRAINAAIRAKAK